MTPDLVMDILADALYLVVMVVAVIVGPSLVVGLMVSMFQAATQINEQTLSFLPRLLITLGTIMTCGAWLITKFSDLFIRLYTNIPNYIG